MALCAAAPIDKRRWADIDSDSECEEEWSVPLQPSKTRCGDDSPDSASTQDSEQEKQSDDEKVVAPPEEDEWTTVSKKKGKGKPTPAPWAKPAEPARVVKPAPWAKPPAPAAKPPVKEAKESKPEPVKSKEPELRAKAPAEKKPDSQRKSSGEADLQQRKVYAGVDDGEFKAIKRILGPGGSNLRKIASSGAVLSLRGRGVDKDSTQGLHMLIKAKPEDMHYAVAAVEALFNRVRDEAEAFYAKAG